MTAGSSQLTIRQPVIAAGAGIAVLISAGLVWFATEQGTATAAYLGGLLALGLGGWFFSRSNAAPDSEEFAAPDWSVTVAAIDTAGGGVAIADRANRMTCANEKYIDWFGPSDAPPNLPLDHSSRENLSRAAREAWRDGEGFAERLNGNDGMVWKARAARAGRGEDFLVWHFEALLEEDPLGQLSKRISGALGKMLTRAGIEAAIVGPDGAIRVVSPGFAHRASGDAKATMAGQEFATLLRADERERIFFSREGRRGAPQTLIHVPLGDLETDTAPGPDEAPSLMMLIEAGVGIGGGFGGEGQAGSAQLEGLLAALPLGLAMTDRDGRMLFGNDAFLRACELPEGGLPRYPTDLVVKEDKAAISDAVRRYGRGSANIGDIAVRLKSSPEEPVSLGLAGMRGLGEAAVLLSLSDSTEETKLKRQVAQATKMQAVGQLAGGVAHDFNNVLTAIIGYCDLMLLRHTPGDSDYDDIQQIRANSNRAASLTRQLLAFSRQQTLRPVVIQLPDVISEVRQLLNRLLGQTIEFKVQHDRDLGPVRADPQQLEQVIVNLAVNARDAIQANRDGRGKGELSFATRRVAARNVVQMGSDIIPPADYTVLIVEDNGGGIPQDKLGKIFEPFFTTKEQGKGTGLGLSTVYGIVKQSGGYIFADNVPGDDGRIKGARFTIYLPVHTGKVPASEEPEKPAEEPTSSWSGGANILLVEDEDMVRAVAERALTRQGYTVTTAADGELGLAEVANGGEFDLIVSDVVMPGMDGPAMARAIRKVAPDLPVIFMSGYAEEQLRNDIDIPGMHFMAKPFSVDQISKKVAGVLGASKGKE
ncbi:response regulator [Altererythrobacter sp. ZODW24]|uniref:hybrid sensor histidine kinase/response regulator n=1 Tax=Altererythrobacter sp. ZODW24 TaxID=2185142 RepID=UPI000DF79B33|nr:response regulator [Altererythrobacter sp. ZODW24]